MEEYNVEASPLQIKIQKMFETGTQTKWRQICVGVGVDVDVGVDVGVAVCVSVCLCVCVGGGAWRRSCFFHILIRVAGTKHPSMFACP